MMHYKSIHSENSKEVDLGTKVLDGDLEILHTCSICDQQFNWKSDLLRHSKIHSDDPKQKCEGCDKEFSRKDYLRKPLIDCNRFTCKVCQQKFSKEKDIIRLKCSHGTQKIQV